jgi:cytoskeleton protein RodZ
MSEQQPDSAGAPTPVEPVGTVLARAREAAGLGLEEAARRLKFAPRQLDALERGEWSRLPGGAAVRGMVRSYARLLDLDADALVARVGAGQALPDAERLAQRFRQPVPFSNGSRRSNLAYAVLSVVLLAVVAAVVLQWRQERAGAARLSFVSAAQQPAEPARIELASAASQTSAAPQPSTAPPATVATVASAAPKADEAGATPGGWHRIVLRFEEESWVEITSGTGKLLVSHLHPAGSERVVDGVPPFSLVIGNAQHVQLVYDNQPVDLKPHIKVEVARLTLN